MLSLLLLDPLTLAKPPKLEETSKLYQNYLSHYNKIPLKTWYFDSSNEGGKRNEAKVFTKEAVDKYSKSYNRYCISLEPHLVSNARAGKANHGEWYANGAKLVAEAADVVNMTGKRALVIGSQNPWVEAVLLSK